jgi:hypothetical protein
MYKRGWRAVKATGGRPFRIRRGVISRKGAKLERILSFLNFGSWRLGERQFRIRRRVFSRKGAKAQSKKRSK